MRYIFKQFTKVLSSCSRGDGFYKYTISPNIVKCRKIIFAYISLPTITFVQNLIILSCLLMGWLYILFPRTILD